MKAYQKMLMIVASLSLGLLFVFPMWKIYLKAPQYPEGLELHIWVNKLGGSSESVLQNFNILNHYIGMKPIHAASFAELQFMPYIVIAFMVTGVLVGLVGKRKLVLGWTGLLMLAGAAGIVDFYLWLVNFGTNLDPMAAIKVPGMTYIPPLLGNKQLLNFEALSLPALGSLGIFMAITIAGLSYIFSLRNQTINPVHEKGKVAVA
ncbi:hypothetical protein JAO76_09005 [Pontibacter sp. BT310]|uniref:Copper chaperone NosL n=1 Tax=Pontibacter populi TaxID=890055 RepID=A0ABS6XDJ3_9BACT|nr:MULTISPECIES: hypothetical protein [Pontibacter]MBJ6118328.1 hypothetical protein [Pontibacter sp. BT310]MBR0570755.1 hypothetical protein [Microvirga sp. STS03]MBW3365181.1 hypothetical protein [Pontibacter populi]